MDKIIEDLYFIFNICFSDEYRFTINSLVHRHNLRYWNDENSHWMRGHTQRPQRINICTVGTNVIVAVLQ